MRILGIDPGSYATGFGLVEETSRALEGVESGVIHPPARHDFLQRLLYIHDEMDRMLDRLRPDQVAVENPFVARNPRSAMLLGQARAAALLPAAKRGLPVFEYAPRQVKLAVVGHGQAEKTQVARMVAVLLKTTTPPKTLDASDALAVAVCHAFRQAGLKKLTTRSA